MPTSAPPAFPSLFPLPYFSIRFSEYLQKSQNSVFCLWGLRREERLGQNAACVVLTREKIKYEGGRGAVGSTDIQYLDRQGPEMLEKKGWRRREGTYHTGVHKLFRMSFWGVNRVSHSQIYLYYSPMRTLNNTPLKKNTVLLDNRVCTRQRSSSYTVAFYSITQSFMIPLPMSRASPRSLKFRSATSKARLNSVPRQRSMYVCLWVVSW
jgi:hypothetical protein